MPRRPDLPCSGCGKLIWRGTGRKTDLCRSCLGHVDRPLDHGDLAMYEKRKCRCDLCRAAKRESMRQYTAKRRADGNPLNYEAYRKRVAKFCPTCGVEFQARVDVRFCSKSCNPRIQLQQTHSARRRRMSVEGRAFRTRAEKVAAEAAVGTTGGKLVWVNGPCGVCGNSFMSRGQASRYCSKECRAVKQSLGSNWIDWRSRRVVYIRDRWTCQICRRTSLLGAKDDSRPTLDHIVPRSKGGTHELSNLRLLCSRCNSKRGDLTYFTDEEVRIAFSS